MTTTSATTTAVHQAALRLARAASTGFACEPVRSLIGPTDVSSAYAVQRQLTEARVSTGSTIVGHKIGLTSLAVQQQLGVSQPDFGVLFDDMVVADGGTAPMKRLLQPKVEAEVAFVLGADLDGDLDYQTVRRSIDHAIAAIEIVDSRIAAWDISFADTVADNASSGLFVLGRERVRLDVFHPVYVEMSLRVNGEQISSGNGAACLGDPLEAVTWLARAAQDLGEPLRAEHLVLSGALGPMVDVADGDIVSTDITGLGAVSVRFGNDKEQL